MMQFYYFKDHQTGFKQHFVMKCQCNYQLVAIASIVLPIMSMLLPVSLVLHVIIVNLVS